MCKTAANAWQSLCKGLFLDLGRAKKARIILLNAGGVRFLELDVYLDALKAFRKIAKHLISSTCSLVNSPLKLCRFDEHVARGALLTVNLQPFDGPIDLLAALKARNFQRQIVE